MRTALAPTSALTDARGHNEKDRPCQRGCDRRRSVVSPEFKADRREWLHTRASLTSTQSGLSDALKLASALSLGPPINASNGADNEHSLFRKADSDNRGSY
jgi:hypothetical protein